MPTKNYLYRAPGRCQQRPSTAT